MEEHKSKSPIFISKRKLSALSELKITQKSNITEKVLLDEQSEGNVSVSPTERKKHIFENFKQEILRESIK